MDTYGTETNYVRPQSARIHNFGAPRTVPDPVVVTGSPF